MQARKEKEIEARRKRDADEIQRNATIGIDALPNLNPEHVQPDVPVMTPKCVISEAAGTDLTNTLESKMEDEVAFYCPHCDFTADRQIVMGDHVVLSHTMAHIARNARRLSAGHSDPFEFAILAKVDKKDDDTPANILGTCKNETKCGTEIKEERDSSEEQNQSKENIANQCEFIYGI